MYFCVLGGQSHPFDIVRCIPIYLLYAAVNDPIVGDFPDLPRIVVLKCRPLQCPLMQPIVPQFILRMSYHPTRCMQ